MVGGLFEKSGDKVLDNEKWAKSRVEGVRESSFRLQELGRAATAEFEDTMREELRGVASIITDQVLSGGT